jgi:hypothetical protein
MGVPMVPSGVAEIVELIWHFTGYLRLDPDGVARVDTKYNGALGQNPEDLSPPDITVKPFAADPNDMDSDRSPLVNLPDPTDYQWVINLHSHPHDPAHPFEPINVPLSPLGKLPTPPFPVGGGADNFFGSSETFGTVKAVINQEIIDLRQFNDMQNNDYASIGPTTIPLQPFDSLPMLTSMLNDAVKAVPANLLPEEGNSTSTLEFLNMRDSNPAATQAHDFPYTVSEGKYVNGELQGPDTDVHQVTNNSIDIASTALDAGRAEPPPHGDYSDTAIQKLTLGSNFSVNDAAVISDSGLCGSMLVLGNSYQTDAIFQTNVLAQTNHLEVAPGGEGGINMIPDTVQNIADISTTGGIEGPWIAGGPLNWQIQILHGSLYDVKAMSQINYISDNDVISQTQSFGYSLILAGSNEQVNSVDFQSPMGQWDLIVVEGSYHRLDMINQTNVVLDMNYASQGWTGSNGDSGTQGIDAGNNTLLNDASITYFGATGSLGTSESMLALAAVLGKEQTPDSSLIASAFPNLMGTINVLYVQGDYYDVNYLSQTNIISDADVAAQLLTTQGNGGQSMSTGGNMAVNAATMVDAGSLTTPYVQGASYSDTLLIQTNIIATDSKVVTNDPAKLAPEVVAFTGTDATDHPTDAPQLFAPTDSQQHQDVLGGTLH